MTEADDRDHMQSFMSEVRRNWLVLSAIVLGGTGVWFTQQADFKYLQEKVVTQQGELRELRIKVDNNERAANDRLANVQRDINDVKVATGRIESTLQIIIRQYNSPRPTE